MGKNMKNQLSMVTQSTKLKRDNRKALKIGRKHNCPGRMTVPVPALPDINDQIH